MFSVPVLFPGHQTFCWLSLAARRDLTGTTHTHTSDLHYNKILLYLKDYKSYGHKNIM